MHGSKAIHELIAGFKGTNSGGTKDEQRIHHKLLEAGKEAEESTKLTLVCHFRLLVHSKCEHRSG